MLIRLLLDALGKTLTILRGRQIGDSVAEIGRRTTASTTEGLALLAKATTIIDDGDAPRAGGLGDGATKRLGESRMMIQQGVPVPDV